MVNTKSNHKASTEPLTDLKIHQRKPHHNRLKSALMLVKGSTQPDLKELSAKVDRLASQLESVLEWIQSQPKPKTRETPLREKFEDRASLKCHTEEDPDNETYVILPRGSHKPFKVEA
ncbi:hypothetical protein Tco_0388796 [Tanacetum coccineum]